MSMALQVVLFIASVAFIGLTACLIPLAFQARCQLKQLAVTADQLKIKLEVLMADSRELMRNMNTLTTRANQQMDDVNQVVRTVNQWTQRADRLVNEVGSAVEPSVFSFVRNLNLVRTGITTFIQALLNRNHHNETQKPTTEDQDYV